MPNVLVAGAAMVPFSRKAGVSADLLAARAIRTLFAEVALDRELVEETYCGTVFGGSLIAQRALRYAGLARGMPVYNLENACASGGTAINAAYRSITSGNARCALVVGVDKLSDLGSGTLPIQQTEWEGAAGVAMPMVYAMRATRYMWETGATRNDLANVSVKSHEFSRSNPVAHFADPWTADQVLNSRPVADPLTLFQCSPKSDGAAAVLLVADDFAREHGLTSAPRIRASVVVSGVFSLAERDITRPDITVRASQAAYAAAEVGPNDLDVAEVHDAFSIAELLYYEELGLCEHGGGAELLRSGRTRSLDDIETPVVNPSGGLLGRGHPVGATGVAQIVECYEQLLGRSGARQRAGAKTALAHVTGGGASGFDNGACSVTILTID